MTTLQIANYALSKIGEYKVAGLAVDVPAVNRINACYPQVLDLVLRRHRWNCARADVRLTPNWVTPTSITNSATLVKVNLVAHGLVTGNRINLDGTSYDSTWFITRVDADSFTLDDSVYSTTSLPGRYAVIPQFGYGWQMDLPSNCITARSVNGVAANAADDIWEPRGRRLLTNQEEVNLVYTKRMTEAEIDTDADADFIEALSTKLAVELCLGIVGSEKKRNQLNLELESVIYPTAILNNAVEKFTTIIANTYGNSGYESRNYDNQ